MENSAGELYLDGLYSAIDLTAAQNPDIARVDTIGAADGSGAYPIKRIVITGSDAGKCAVTEKPRILITGATHGDEQLSAEIAVKLAAHLTELYQTDPQVSELLAACEIHIIPVLNPWGVVNNMRKTAEDVDINRDFGSPDPVSEEQLYNSDWFHPWYGGFTAKESRILRDLCERERYILSIQGHTGAENINLPMDYLGYFESDEVPDEGNTDYLDTYIPIFPLMESFAMEYVASVNEKRVDIVKFYYTEGFDWYEVIGSFTDWHFGALGAPGYTIEYDTLKGVPSNETAETVWLEHKEALINLLEISSRRISGMVTAASNSPVEALITFQRAADGSRAPGDPTPITLSARSDPETGYFHILIPDGDWDMTVSSAGYIEYTETVIKSGDEPFHKNIQLSSSP